ncbi:uncharacterized protein LOC106156482 [Lingula anatina]|uniref:Uncharacterized protein LOC106156482 n=1 Tax=Lingula anatina TaxID=7574 RepID=A0A1S3HM91_LINAN|nr:uncharacterized protein LOC106156482 [Lingula anatina]|eukprot:XP_013387200.1 uncharacterized protein LOC106156482 [Lingula anatina]
MSLLWRFVACIKEFFYPTVKEPPAYTTLNLVGVSDNVFCFSEDQKKLKDLNVEKIKDGQLPSNHAKIVVLGDPRVGKTSLLRRLLGQSFRDDEQSTPGLDTKYVEGKKAYESFEEVDRGDSIDRDTQESASYLVAKELIPHPPVCATASGLKHINAQDFGACYVIAHVSKLLVMTIPSVVLFSLHNVLGFPLIFSCVWFSAWVIGLLDTKNNFVSVIDASAVGMTMVNFLIRKNPLAECFDWLKDTDICCIRGNFSSSHWVFLCDIIHRVGYITPEHFFSGIICSFGHLLVVVLAGWTIGFVLGLRIRKWIVFPAFLIMLPSVKSNEQHFSVTHLAFLAVHFSYVLGVSIGVGITSRNYMLSKTNALKEFPRNMALHVVTLTLFIFLMPIALSEYKEHFFCQVTLSGGFGIVFGLMYALASHSCRNLKSFLFQNSGIYSFFIGVMACPLYLHSIGWTVVDLSVLAEQPFWLRLIFVISPLIRLGIEIRRKFVLKTFDACGVDLISISRHMSRINLNLASLPTFLNILDFAGQEKYRSWHHLFMSKHGIYLLVFNLAHVVESPEAPERQLKDLEYWLNSIFAHTSHPDSVILLVGTHARSFDKSLENRVKEFETILKRRILSNPKYEKRLYTCDFPFFRVDNKVDENRAFKPLRDAIKISVREAEFMTAIYPIAWRSALVYFSRWCNEGNFFIRKTEAKNNFNQNYPWLKEGDFERMIDLADSQGHVIYRPKNGVLSDIIVLNPDILIAVFTLLSSIDIKDVETDPKMRKHKKEARDLVEKGILDENLFVYIAKRALEKYLGPISDPHKMSQNLAVLKELLIAFDFICPIQKQFDSCFLVPSLLPSEACAVWNEEECHVFYLDFRSFAVTPVFDRLLAKCLCSQNFSGHEYSRRPSVFRGCGIFCSLDGCHFKIQARCRIPQQNLIKISLEKQYDAIEILKFLHREVGQICKNDFPNVHFILGFKCQVLGFRHKNFEQDSRECHIIPLCEQQQELSFPENSTYDYSCGISRQSKVWTFSENVLQQAAANMGLKAIVKQPTDDEMGSECTLCEGCEVTHRKSVSGGVQEREILTDKILYILATEHVGSTWHDVGMCLGIPAGTLDLIEKNQESPKKKKFEVFRQWKMSSNKPENIKLAELKKAFCDCNRQDLVTALEELIRREAIGGKSHIQ